MLLLLLFSSLWIDNIVVGLLIRAVFVDFVIVEDFDFLVNFVSFINNFMVISELIVDY